MKLLWKNRGYDKRRFTTVGVMLSLVVVVVANVLIPTTGYATNRNDNNWNNANSVEQRYVNDGYSAGVWLSSPGKSYRDSTVDVPYGSTSVSVQIRGSWYTNSRKYKEVTTHNLKSIDGKVSDIKTETFSRGTADRPGVSGYFVYNDSNYSAATLNVGSVCSGKAGQTTTMNVVLQSTFRYRYDGSSTFSTGYPSNDTTKVTVKCASHWTTTGKTSVAVNGVSGKTTAAPGDTIRWTHTLKNNGPNDISRIRSQTANTGFSNTSFNGLQNVVDSSMNSGTTRTLSSYATYTVSEADVGGTLCQQLQWDPVNSSGDRNGRTTNTCITIPYDYNLVPSVSLDKDTADVGTEVNITGKINNTGTTKTKDTNWQLSYITIPAGKSTPNVSSGNNGISYESTNPCAYYKKFWSYITCAEGSFTNSGYSDATGHNTFPSGLTTFSPRTTVVPDLPVGTKVCYALSVQPYSQSTTDWRHSNLTCLTVSKHPVFQTLGGDIIVGRNGGSSRASADTSTKDVGGKRYGSWGEYGVIVSGSVSGLASASGYAGGSSKTSICDVSYLTLNNTSTATSSCSTSGSTLGSYTYGAAAATAADRFTTTSSSPKLTNNSSVKPGDLTNRATYTTDSNATVTLLASEMPASKWVVINAPSATIKISGNLTYTNASLTGISDIPQLVIIAKKIIIADNVTQVDAWLVSANSSNTGAVNTCGAGGVTETQVLTSKMCDQQLTINGPVITNHLVLRRTAGAGTGTASGDPAEVFNLRPDAYLWALSLQTSTAKAQTVQTVELPPRY